MRTMQRMTPAGVHSSRYASRQESCDQNKWQLLKTIEEIREPLGLKGTSIALLRAMISFLRVDSVSAARDDAHICFASNASLAKRAHVSIQTVERHIAKLVSLGLLTRRSSGNGKRWARRDRKGHIVLATGLSLLPLAERHAEFVEISHAHQDLQNELGRLRDLCSAALAKLKLNLPSDAHTTLIAKARNLLRRQPEKGALTQLLDEISVEISKIHVAEPNDLRDTAPENEGHKETSKIQYVKKETPIKIEVNQDELERAYPRLCAELRIAKSPEHCHHLMDDIAQQLNLGNTWFSIKEQGPALSFMILGYLLERIETIRNYRGYAYKLTEDLLNQNLEWESLLKRPKRTPPSYAQ